MIVAVVVVSYGLAQTMLFSYPSVHIRMQMLWARCN